MTRMSKSDKNETIYSHKIQDQIFGATSIIGQRNSIAALYISKSNFHQRKMKKQINSILREMNAVLMIQVIRDGIKMMLAKWPAEISYMKRVQKIPDPTHINSLSGPAAAAAHPPQLRETVALSTDGKQDNGGSLFSGHCG